MHVSMIALSDSHAASIENLPCALRNALQAVEIVVHAGDHTELSLLEDLRARVPLVIAVSGNMDSTAVKVHLPPRQIVTVNGRTLGVAHGSGAPAGIAERVRALFPENPDLIVFGHSHVPFNAVVDGTLMVNPGPAMKSYARIVVGQTLSADIVPAE